MSQDQLGYELFTGVIQVPSQLGPIMKRSEINFDKTFRGTISADDLAKRKDCQGLGLGKGLTTSFSEGEIIYFPEKSKAQFRVGTFTDKLTQKKTSTIAIWAPTSEQSWVLIPAAMFRRVPRKKEEIASFRENNELGVQLAAAGIEDLEMLEYLYGQSVQIDGIIEASVPEFAVVNGAWEIKKDADGNVVYKSDSTLACYKTSVVAEEE